jgi:hypothetical protein
VVYVWQTPIALTSTLVVGLVLLFGSNFNLVLPLLVINVLHAGATGLGWLSSIAGLGALLATFWLAWGNRTPTMSRVLGNALLFSVLLSLFALSRLYPLSLILLAGVGFLETTFAAQALTALQLETPDVLRGRVTGVQVLLFDGTLPLGYLLVGWLAGVCGVSLTLLLCALLCLLIVGGGWIWLASARSGTT